MDRMTVRVVLGCLFWALGSAPGRALDSRTDFAIRTATFEFFAPGKDSSSKGLVGTAFAIGPNEFVTAAHLLDTAIGSRFESPVLVDAQQVEYRIADILQFSEKRDYVIFSLKRPPPIRPLAIQPNEPDSRELYFAGWHSSRKVLIEHGTPSGLTPEEESKEFDWLRFSGPVWGAAGGGPVLNGSGQVVGIIQGVARNGNANYAVPINLLSSAMPHSARLHATEMLRSLMPAVSSVEPLDAEIPLPMSLENFSREVQQLRRAYFDRVVGPLLEATRSNFVLTGEGAADTCNLLNGSNCQCKPRSGATGTLLVNDLRPNESKRPADVLQTLAGATLIRTTSRQDDTRGNHDPVSNASFHLKLVLQSATRQTQGSDASGEMRSWAAQREDRVYVDFHDRAWRMRAWPLLDRDLEVVSMAREVSDGYVVVTRTVPTALEYAAELQLKFIGNLIYYQCQELSGEGVAQVADTMSR